MSGAANLILTPPPMVAHGWASCCLCLGHSSILHSAASSGKPSGLSLPHQPCFDENHLILVKFGGGSDGV